VGYLTSICQVALGDMNELLNADYDANNLPKGKLRSVADAVFLLVITPFVSLNHFLYVFLWPVLNVKLYARMKTLFFPNHCLLVFILWPLPDVNSVHVHI
jgi:hypothetical protein